MIIIWGHLYVLVDEAALVVDLAMGTHWLKWIVNFGLPFVRLHLTHIYEITEILLLQYAFILVLLKPARSRS